MITQRTCVGFPSDGGNVKDLNLEEVINTSFHAVNTAHRLPEHRNLKLPTRESLFISVKKLYIELETSKKYLKFIQMSKLLIFLELMLL